MSVVSGTAGIRRIAAQFPEWERAQHLLRIGDAWLAVHELLTDEVHNSRWRRWLYRRSAAAAQAWGIDAHARGYELQARCLREAIEAIDAATQNAR